MDIRLRVPQNSSSPILDEAKGQARINNLVPRETYSGSYAGLFYADKIVNLLIGNRVSFITKLLAIFVLSIAVQFIFDGITALLR